MLAIRSVLAAFTVAIAALSVQAHGAEEKSITVFAAASMRNALDEVDTLFTNQSGIKVVASYAASSALMEHIEQGASADVFLSADTEWMDYGAKRNLINNETRENLLGNRLVLTAPTDSKVDKVSIAPGFDLAALIGNGRIATGDVRAVPAGLYAKAALETLGVWSSVKLKLTMSENVRAALVLVSRGGAPLGIVYETDAKIDPGVKIVGVFPEDSHPPIIYPVAMTKEAKLEAAKYLAFLTTPEATAVFERYGFRVLAKPTILPVSVENGQLIVNADINGQGPFPMLFDTGSVEAITPETATALRLSLEGAGTVRGGGDRAVSVALTHLQTLRLGGAELSDMALPVIPLPQFITDRGNRAPLAGLIGFGVLSRFAVRLSYDDQTLTLIPAGDFRYSGRGERVPLFFADKTPVISAVADGDPGSFEIDTGSSTALVLQRAFVEQHGLEARHPHGLRIKVGGVGGVFDTVATRLDRFDLAASKIERPAVEFPSRDGEGIPVAGIDGSVGYQILRQFVITFDYSRREIWFERSAAFGASTIEWKTGFQAVKVGDTGFRVVTVQPDTPAANAGIRVGDLITVIDGQPAASVGQAEFGGLTRRADGTIVQLEINRSGNRLSIAVALKELLP
jgi:molybdate transport system substrate-binding protein